MFQFQFQFQVDIFNESQIQLFKGESFIYQSPTIESHQLNRLHRDLQFGDMPPPTEKPYVRLNGQFYLPHISTLPWIVSSFAPVPATASHPGPLRKGSHIHILYNHEPDIWCFGTLGGIVGMEKEFIIYTFEIDLHIYYQLPHTTYIAIPRHMVHLSPVWLYLYITQVKQLPSNIINLWVRNLQRPQDQGEDLHRSMTQ